MGVELKKIIAFYRRLVKQERPWFIGLTIITLLLAALSLWIQHKLQLHPKGDLEVLPLILYSGSLFNILQNYFFIRGFLLPRKEWQYNTIVHYLPLKVKNYLFHVPMALFMLSEIFYFTVLFLLTIYLHLLFLKVSVFAHIGFSLALILYFLFFYSMGYFIYMFYKAFSVLGVLASLILIPFYLWLSLKIVIKLSPLPDIPGFFVVLSHGEVLSIPFPCEILLLGLISTILMGISVYLIFLKIEWK